MTNFTPQQITNAGYKLAGQNTFTMTSSRVQISDLGEPYNAIMVSMASAATISLVSIGTSAINADGLPLNYDNGTKWIANPPIFIPTTKASSFYLFGSNTETVNVIYLAFNA